MVLTVVVDAVVNCENGSEKLDDPKLVYRYSANTFQFSAKAYAMPPPPVHPIIPLLTASSVPAVAPLSAPVNCVRTN